MWQLDVLDLHCNQLSKVEGLRHLSELRVLNNSSGIIEVMIREFGVDADGHILYDTFVDLLMSTTNSYAPEQPKPGAL